MRASQPPPPRKPAGSHGSTLEAPPQQYVCLFALLSSRSSLPLCLTRSVLRWLQPCPSSSSLHSPSTTSSTKDHGSSDGLSQSSCEPSVRKSEAHSSKVCPPPPAPPSLFTFPSSSLSLARSLSSLRPPSLFSSRQPRDVLERSLPFPSGMGASDTRPSTRVQQVLLRKQRTRAGRKRAHHPCLACSRLRRRTLVHWMLGLRGACSRLRVGEPLQTIGLSFSRCFPVPTCSCRQCSIALPVACYVVRFPKFFTTTDGQIVQITSSRHNGGIWSLQPDSQPPGHILVWNTLLRRELADEVCHRSPTSSREIFRLPSLFRFLNSLCCALRALAKTPWVHHTLPLVLSSRELRRILTSHESSPRKSCPSGISFSPTRWSPFASPLCMRR